MSTWKVRKKKGQPRDFGKPAPETMNVSTWETLKAGFSILKFFALVKKWFKRIFKI